MTYFGRTFRLVCEQQAIPIVENLLESQGFDFEPEPFYEFARKLVHEPFPLGESLAARFGLVYIQDRSSMLPPLTLAPPIGASVLDMCSAPGSKTSLLSRLVGRQGFVFASEPSADRLGTLRANLRRTGSVNAVTAKAMAQDLPFQDCTWDYIQLDPPCSGWGTVDKNPKVMEVWSGSKTAPLVALQKTLLERATAMLKPGGVVLYSTCTTNIEENEQQVTWALEFLDLELEPLAEPKGFVFGEPLLPGMAGVLRVAEDSDGQGFFLARFRKKDTGSATTGECVQKRELPGNRLKLSAMVGGHGLDMSRLPPGEVYDFGGKAFFLHEQALAMVPGAVRWQGFPLGKISGKGDRMKFIPGPMARVLLPEDASRADVDVLDVEEAGLLEQLFTGQSISFRQGKGPVGLYYRGLSLGWLSRKGNRLLWSAK
ncbi:MULTISPECIES: RsmB/NOP family class I SAM-dependent RNA methyltransferase [unclassified Pseudodesulfovibrio]|uniref:RsmB/NOP family class I SAM-dependent RNA methyltransferase n=1 Tax=unclassified Pseudodesulfovibrio TaxID=2661612 RepID=UPI000FEBB242|nr:MULTISPECIES: RsmB/NOP family class I SAM-dependent RNA methyltransferase [unclassified Pseudodesulfovibrio]MCJ2164362.1 RsmB/NOP family class I SAM-dependent RNA methyltransferase [Pseudodesulfovibrio sp. S3-i]RWU04571.1 RsmB/NOP family class I SAM-dependent RNA methyltransferase [Pseudodesulfovibrio sp. S3]